jgi:hypothetical protein
VTTPEDRTAERGPGPYSLRYYLCPHCDGKVVRNSVGEYEHLMLVGVDCDVVLADITDIVS